MFPELDTLIACSRIATGTTGSRRQDFQCLTLFSKSTLECMQGETKICERCGRTLEWRKKWPQLGSHCIAPSGAGGPDSPQKTSGLRPNW